MRAPPRLREILEGSPFPIVLVCAVGALLLAALAPSLLVGDSWLTLMAGREVVQHGLPDTESVTLLGAGATWTDQQWLAQVVFYAAHQAAGIRGVVLLDVVLVLATLAVCAATARCSGATSRATFLVGLLAVVAGPWGWTVRAQTPALPLFAMTLWLLVDASRRGLRRRTLLVLPLLALWSNVHGSVVLGALLAVLLGLTELARRRSVGSALALVAVAPLCTLASPYLWKLAAYYDLMLVSPPFKDILREWAWSKPGATTFLFYVLAALTVALLALGRSRSRLTVFELLVIAITLVGAVQAVRGVIWFSLAAFAILPVALDGVLRRPDVVAPRVNRAISTVAIAALVAAAVSAGFRPTSWFLEDWPRQEADAVATATRNPETRLFATDRHSDWLLWRLPSLRGRIAFDVRFELYDRRTLEDIVRYNGELTSDWKEIADGYDVILLDEQKPPSHLDDFLAEPGTKLLYRDGEIAIVRRLGSLTE